MTRSEVEVKENNDGSDIAEISPRLLCARLNSPVFGVEELRILRGAARGILKLRESSRLVEVIASWRSFLLKNRHRKRNFKALNKALGVRLTTVRALGAWKLNRYLNF